MPEFCSENTETITGANYMNQYQSTSCLPNAGTGFPASSFSRNGMINKSDLDAHVTRLLSQRGAAAPSGTSSSIDSSSPAEEYAKKAADLRANINTEYCFYYKRYMYILREILMTAATSSGSTSSDYISKKQNTEKLNSKLNQILQILQSIVNSRSDTLRDYYGTTTGVNELNTHLDTSRRELIKHSKLLKDNEMEKDAKAAMVEYTIEKNNSSRNLLAIYGFMNIVAASLIYYLYRSASPE